MGKVEGDGWQAEICEKDKVNRRYKLNSAAKRIRPGALNSIRVDQGKGRSSAQNSGFWKTLSILLILAAGFSIIASSITATLDSDDGSSAFEFRDSASTVAASIDSDGNIQARGGLRLDADGAECDVAERLIVDGRVGIGATSPVATLHVRDLIAGADVDARIEDSTDAQLQFSDSVDDARYLGLQSNGDMYLGASNGSTFILKDSGDCGIGITSPYTKLDVNGDMRLGVNGAHVKLAFYRYNTSANVANQYIHLQTNQTMNTKMTTIRFYGYEYGGTKTIDAQLSYYPYGGSGTLIHVCSSGTHSLNAYKGAGNFVILTIYVSSTYYVGFYLDAYGPNPTGSYEDIAITAATYSSSATGVY